MVNFDFLRETYQAMSGSKWIDIKIDNFEKIGDDNGLEWGLKWINWLLAILEEDLKFICDFLQPIVQVEFLIECQIGFELAY